MFRSDKDGAGYADCEVTEVQRTIAQATFMVPVSHGPPV
jgi:hypothetical protein